jgi:hypothetical protein
VRLSEQRHRCDKGANNVLLEFVRFPDERADGGLGGAVYSLSSEDDSKAEHVDRPREEEINHSRPSLLYADR